MLVGNAAALTLSGASNQFVPVGDPVTLRTEICRLLSQPEEAMRLGSNGRKLVESEMNLDLYAQRLAGFLDEVVNTRE